jgi:hypothetical protein
MHYNIKSGNPLSSKDAAAETNNLPLAGYLLHLLRDSVEVPREKGTKNIESSTLRSMLRRTGAQKKSPSIPLL